VPGEASCRPTTCVGYNQHYQSRVTGSLMGTPVIPCLRWPSWGGRHSEAGGVIEDEWAAAWRSGHGLFEPELRSPRHRRRDGGSVHDGVKSTWRRMVGEDAVYDVVIIGSGPGGTWGRSGGQLGLRTAIVERADLAVCASTLAASRRRRCCATPRCFRRCTGQGVWVSVGDVVLS